MTDFPIKNDLVISYTTGITGPANGEKTRLPDTERLANAEAPTDVEREADVKKEALVDVKKGRLANAKEEKLADAEELIVIYYKH